MTLNRRTLLAGLAAAPLAAAPLRAPALAQAPWPTQNVRLVVPFAAGGPTDIPARLFAEELSKLLPQRVVVENRTGAGAVVGADIPRRNGPGWRRRESRSRRAAGSCSGRKR